MALNAYAIKTSKIIKPRTFETDTPLAIEVKKGINPSVVSPGRPIRKFPDILTNPLKKKTIQILPNNCA